jgi:hypothetical protein
MSQYGVIMLQLAARILVVQTISLRWTTIEHNRRSGLFGEMEPQGGRLGLVMHPTSFSVNVPSFELLSKVTVRSELVGCQTSIPTVMNGPYNNPLGVIRFMHTYSYLHRQNS